MPRLMQKKLVNRSKQCLLEKNYVTSEDLAKQLLKEHGLPYIEKVTDAMADLAILAKIPLKFLA